MKQKLYAVQTLLKLDNRIINQKMILFAADNDEDAQEFVNKEIEYLNKSSIAETEVVKISKYPTEMKVQSSKGGTKVYKIVEK